MAIEEPEVRPNVELGTDETLAVWTAILADFGDAIEHQHRRQRQLRIARPEEFTAPASEDFLVAE